MNAAGFFYISADFPLPNSAEVADERPQEDLANEDCSMYPNGTFKAPYAKLILLHAYFSSFQLCLHLLRP